MSAGFGQDASSRPSLVDEVLQCAQRTLDAQGARILYRQETDFHWPQTPSPRRRGGLLRPVGKALKLAGKEAWQLASHKWDFRHLEAEGFIEPAERRYMLDFGSYAELFDEGERWTGRSGSPRSSLQPWRHDEQHRHVWWLLDTLRGTTAAALDGEEMIGGDNCRRIDTRVDLSRASALTEGGLRPPSVERFEDLLALPLTVWIDDRHIRRVRFSEGHDAAITRSVELWDYGVPTGGLDWSRLPTFRLPDEAA